MRTWHRVVFGLILFLSMTASLPAQKKAEPVEFSVAVVEPIMRQLRDGLIARNADSVLAAFDPNQMPTYSQLAGDLRGFLSKWDNIRIHYQINQSEPKECGKEQCGTAQVQFQMEADDTQSVLPSLNRQAQLQLSIQRTDKGWKIVSFTPRDLFR